MRPRGRTGALRRSIGRTALSLRLAGRFVVELVVANIEQARLVLRWHLEVRPRWIEFETCLSSASARTLLGTLISLTPGTLTCDLEGETLRIHALNSASDEATMKRIRDRFESLLVQMEEA